MKAGEVEQPRAEEILPEIQEQDFENIDVQAQPIETPPSKVQPKIEEEKLGEEAASRKLENPETS